MRLVEGTRRLQSALAGSRPDPGVSMAARVLVERAAAALEAAAVDEQDQFSGRLLGLAGRGQALVPPFEPDEWGSEEIQGRTTLTRFYLGANGAAHGGVIPLLFDEVLGELAGTAAAGPVRRRTAYLHVDYRAITPLDRQLQVEARVDRVEGRKMFITGRLTDGPTLLAEAEGLFVALRPGQP